MARRLFRTGSFTVPLSITHECPALRGDLDGGRYMELTAERTVRDEVALGAFGVSVLRVDG